MDEGAIDGAMPVPNLTKEQVEQLEKEGYIVTNLGDKKEDEGEIICKMAISGKASKLSNVVSSIFSTLFSSGGSYSKSFDTQIKLTIMVEKVKEI